MLTKLTELSEELLGYSERNKGTLWQVIKAYAANQRQGTVGVKTRAMVKATGKKPYKQKKTGSARRGSFVAPLHVGGGVAHGPQARDYRQAIPPKMAKVALGIALCESLKAGKIYSGALEFPNGKTKEAAHLFQASIAGFGVGKALLCLWAPSEETIRAVKNVRGLILVSPRQINAYDLLQSRFLMITPEAFAIIHSRIS